MQNLKIDKIKLTLNGIEFDATVKIAWDYDDYPRAGQDFDYGDAEANERELARFERGELVSLIVSVSVQGEGLEGTDSLGGVWVNVSKWDADVLECVDFHSMVENATTDLKTNIIDAANRLAKYKAA